MAGSLKWLRGRAPDVGLVWMPEILCCCFVRLLWGWPLQAPWGGAPEIAAGLGP